MTDHEQRTETKRLVTDSEARSWEEDTVRFTGDVWDERIAALLDTREALMEALDGMVNKRGPGKPCQDPTCAWYGFRDAGHRHASDTNEMQHAMRLLRQLRGEAR